MTASSPTLQHIPIRPEWLATRQEAALEPDLPVIDSHHHLYDRRGSRYLFDDMLADVRESGHNVRATVLVQARAMYRADGPEEMRPVGETEFVNGAAAMSASGAYGPMRMCAAIVPYADLRLGERVRPVLEAHLAAGGGRVRGIRQAIAWDADPTLVNSAYGMTEHVTQSAAFRAGFAQLGALGLSFDAWLLFPQIPRLTELARAFPGTPIVLNHCGGVLGSGRFAGRRDEVFAQWSAWLRELAGCPNVMVKLSGLGMGLSGFGFELQDQAPGSEHLARVWRPWMETCIDAFGAERCMFGSNFPVDKGSYGYGIGLNAIKRIVSGASVPEKAEIFSGSAARFYRILLA